MRSSKGKVNVPTPGPYSTNRRVFAQSTGSSILSINTRLDGMIDPTITGFLMKPRRNCQCGLLDRRSRRRCSLRGLFSVRAEEKGMDAPLRGLGEAGALANAPPLGKVSEPYMRRERSQAFREPRDKRDEEVPHRGKPSSAA